MQKRPEWKDAPEMLLLVAERGGPALFGDRYDESLEQGKPNPQLTPPTNRAKAYQVVR